MGQGHGLAAASLLSMGAADASALHTPHGPLTYGQLGEQVAAEAERLHRLLRQRSTERSVVVLRGRPSAPWVTTYLAVRSLGHVPLLAGDRAEPLIDAWEPLAHLDVQDDGATVELAPSTWSPTPLHADLALLLSTSGSTGSPRLVRLSHDNLRHNAESIARSLDLGPTDVGITSLPLHYCYGLSILHSHLAVGASVSIIDASVVDPCFRRSLIDHRVTTVAGVPHTLDLLEAAGPERLHTPWLRRLTQAGGRLDDDARARWRSRCQAWGVDLVIMYGQTEATARIAYLPPALEAAAPSGAIGIAVAGGALRVDQLDDAPSGTGELVYVGPNVMMGYACEPGDLANGPELTELRTGDLGRYDEQSGTFVVTQRASRFLKPFGMRLELDQLEASLGRDLGPVATGGDDQVLVVVAPDAHPQAIEAAATAATGLPPSAVLALRRPIPRTEAGKVDHGHLALLARGARSTMRPAVHPEARPSSIVVSLLGIDEVDLSRTFVEAGGDSLTYVEATDRLGRLVGALPDDWQHLPLAALDALPRRREGDPRRIDTTVLLRAIGIATVVATHMRIAIVPGGAHLLLAVVGYNLSRFQLALTSTSERVAAGLASVRRLAIPTVALAAIVVLTTDRYGWTTVALVNNYLGPAAHRDDHWHYWFIEAVIQLTLAMSLILAIPAVRRAERRWRFGVPLAAVAAAVALREISWAGLDDPANLRFRTHGVAAFFALGWLIERATSRSQRLVASAACVLAIVGFFDLPQREGYIIAALLVLVWARTLPAPAPVIAIASTLASASLWIYLTHFHLWPPLSEAMPIGAAYLLTIAGGVGVWWAGRQLSGRGRGSAATC